VLMATHNLELIRRSDYRTIELDKGRIVYDSADPGGGPRPPSLEPLPEAH
jgi:ABC-type uncharacterized transport system ATPase component